MFKNNRASKARFFFQNITHLTNMFCHCTKTNRTSRRCFSSFFVQKETKTKRSSKCIFHFFLKNKTTSKTCFVTFPRKIVLHKRGLSFFKNKTNLKNVFSLFKNKNNLKTFVFARQNEPENDAVCHFQKQK